MKVATRKMRSPLKVHGGKSYLARRIVSLFPEHETYCEPFFGGGSVLLNKPRSRIEIAGDLNTALVDFWVSLQTNLVDLSRFLGGISYARSDFRNAVSHLKSATLDPEEAVERAGAYLVSNRMSRGGMGKDFAWSERQRGGKPGDVNAWETALEGLPAVSERIRDVRFYESSAFDLVKLHDSPATLFYCDPPYLHATRTHRKAYAHEMTDRDHERLLEALLGCKGRVFLSGYDSPLYRRMLAGWKLHVFSMPNHSSQAKVKQRRIECLWENPSLRIPRSSRPAAPPCRSPSPPRTGSS